MGREAACGELRRRRWDLGFDEKTRRLVVATTSRAYREAMARFAVMRHIDVWYTRLDADGIVQRFSTKLTVKARRRMEADLAKARTKDSVQGDAVERSTVNCGSSATPR